MRKPGANFSVLIVLVVFLSAGLLLLKFKTSPGSGPRQPVVGVAAGPPKPADLTLLYDQDASFDAPGCWLAVPRGEQTIANIPFRINGLIQLWGQGPEGIGRHYRETVEGIPITGKFQTLYALHGSSFISPEGTPIAQVVFRYVDGSSATNAILYGTDSRDWWEPSRPENPLPPGSRSQEVWRGDHESLPDWVKCLRLFGTAIANPKPQAEVKAVDLFSAKSRTTWIVLALTTGPAGLLKIDPQIAKQQAPAEEITVNLVVLDQDSGKPVPDMRLEVTLLSGRRPKFYGFYSTDEKGEAVIVLPPQYIKQVSIQAAAGDYEQAAMSLNLDQGENIPTNSVLKVARKAR